MDALTEIIRKCRCYSCDGCGIAIGPIDENTRQRQVVHCGACGGNGIHLSKVRAMVAKLNGHR